MSSKQCLNINLSQIVYTFLFQNQTTGLANSLADSIIYRSSHSQMFFKVFLKNSPQRNTSCVLDCWSLFLNKVSGLKACKFIKKRLQHRCFTGKFAEFSRTTFFTEHLLSKSDADSQTSFNLKPIITV